MTRLLTLLHPVPKYTIILSIPPHYQKKWRVLNLNRLAQTAARFARLQFYVMTFVLSKTDRDSLINLMMMLVQLYYLCLIELLPSPSLINTRAAGAKKLDSGPRASR